MKRYWITPLTMGAFVLTAVTGLLLFFEVRTGIVKQIHEWLSWTLVIGGTLHVVDHWTGIRKHLDSWWGKGFVAGALVFIGVAIFVQDGDSRGPGRGQPAEQLLGKATVAQIAAISGAKTESVIASLGHAGARDAKPDLTLEEIAATSGVPLGKLVAFAARSAEPPEDDD